MEIDMKVEHIDDIEIIKTGVITKGYITNVTITTGYLWWKKTITMQVCMTVMFWYFTDDGEFVPDKLDHLLEIKLRSYQASRLLSKC